MHGKSDDMETCLSGSTCVVLTRHLATAMEIYGSTCYPLGDVTCLLNHIYGVRSMKHGIFTQEGKKMMLRDSFRILNI